MRRSESLTADPLPQAADLLFPVPFDTPEQRLADVPGLPRIAAANAAQEALVVPVAAGETIAFEDGLAPFPDAIWTPAGRSARAVKGPEVIAARSKTPQAAPSGIIPLSSMFW